MPKKATLIKYGKLNYEFLSLTPSINEIGYPFKTFSNNTIYDSDKPYSLHTEYSASKLSDNTINSLINNGFNVLATSLNRAGKAKLWNSREWTEEFISFIFFIVENRLNSKIPFIIEIHPPYTTRANHNQTLNIFFEYYSIFEQSMKNKFGDQIIILLENRNTTGNFLLSKSSDYIEFNNYIINNNLDLKLIVDIPQLYGKMKLVNPNLEERQVIDVIFNELRQAINSIGGFHICGKGHHGDFNTLFQENKSYFLTKLSELTSTIENDIYVVPEITGQANFESIMSDIEEYQIFEIN